jgi:signal transduction histidine kinase
MPLLTLELRSEHDIILARQRARQIAGLLGCAQLDQTRIATATSEIARNAHQYAGGGRVEFLVASGPPAALVIRILERGPGIRDLQAIIEGRYVSPTGLGVGMAGAQRLMDEFAVESAAGSGAAVVMAKRLPHRVGPPTPQELARVAAELARDAPKGLLEELRQQNQELLDALQELRERQAELAQMHTRELDETNRGVVALYAELDENAKALKRLSDLKSRFLSEMSHELRSPLNSIRSLTGFLLERTDGELTAEQEKQVQLIRRAAEGLSSLVDDLLDLAKVEAGKAVIRAAWFDVQGVFDGLQGTIRPIIDPSAVRLVFDDPTGLPPLRTDEGKLTQILRNLLSNAAKFTERGEIRVAARIDAADHLEIAVSDTGIGIAAGDLPRIFEEFGQIEGPLQARAKGTGLGLPLARKLAEVLGGSVTVRSEPGVGSTFSLVIPRTYYPTGEDEPVASHPGGRLPARPRDGLARALIVDDQEEDRYLIRELLAALGRFDVVEAPNGDEALRRARADRPSVIVLDLGLPDISGFQVLERLKADPATRDIPVIVRTSRSLEAHERALLGERTVSVLAKEAASREQAMARLRAALGRAGLDPTTASGGES